MNTAKTVPAELLEQLRRGREKIATELPELMERSKRLDEAAAENSLNGHLRRAIHVSGRPLKKLRRRWDLNYSYSATTWRES